jgi:hypothetical protein
MGVDDRLLWMPNVARGLLDRIARTRGQAQLQAYEDARSQFNLEQDRERQAQELVNRFGLDALTKQAGLGQQQRAIEAEGIAADRAQFEQEREYPYKMNQYQSSLLQGFTTSNTELHLCSAKRAI